MAIHAEYAPLQTRSPHAQPQLFACKGETPEEYWKYTHRIFEWRTVGART